MPDRHNIRLRGPWWGKTHQAKDDLSADGEAFKTTVPFLWHDQIPNNFIGTVGLTRKFNCSSGMSGAREVWLTISSLTVPAELLLNGSTMGLFDAQSDIELPVSSCLKPFNELQILLSVSGMPPKILLGDVAVEIVQ